MLWAGSGMAGVNRTALWLCGGRGLASKGMQWQGFAGVARLGGVGAVLEAPRPPALAAAAHGGAGGPGGGSAQGRAVGTTAVVSQQQAQMQAPSNGAHGPHHGHHHHGQHHHNGHAGGAHLPNPKPKRWVPPGSWTQLKEVDDHHKVEYSLREWPRRPMPVSVDAALKAVTSSAHFSLDDDLLFRIANRMFEMPKPRVCGSMHTGKRAAVMVPLCEVDGEPSVLFTLRSQNVGTHKGQVSFPGGHLDLEDECMEGCANRECLEELGIRVQAPEERTLWEAEWRERPYFPKSNILGRLPNCVAITGTLVTPIVGHLGRIKISDLDDKFCRAEIDEVFSISLRDLLNPRHVIHESIHMGNHMPAFVCGTHKVWGLTAYILHHFLMEVVVPSLLARRRLPRGVNSTANGPARN